MWCSVTADSRRTPEPDYNDPKEVYAFFGLSAYAAQCLEKELMNLCALVQLSAASARTRDLADALFDAEEAKTLGQLLSTARKLVEIPSEVDGLLAQSLRERNRLIHRFFAEHAERLLSARGRRVMIDELRAYTERFKEADQHVSEITTKFRRAAGFTDELVRREMEDMRRRAAEEDLKL
jgi:hypothetical protein